MVYAYFSFLHLWKRRDTLFQNSKKSGSRFWLVNKAYHCHLVKEKVLKKSKNSEGYPGLVDCVMIWIKEPFIKKEESTKDVFISWVNKI